MTDLQFTHTADGGEIAISNGVFAMSDDGVAAAVYLSLWGGNEDDSGSDGDKPRQWWANLSEPDEAARYRSETQYLLRTIPAVPGNLKRIEDAVGRDLAWMVTGEFSTFVGAVARLPALNTIQLTVSVEVNGNVIPIPLTMPWRAQ
jgi:phage gp46-like protein